LAGFNAFAAANAAAAAAELAELDWSSFEEYGLASDDDGEAVALGFGCLDDVLSAGGLPDSQAPVVLEGGAALAAALAPLMPAADVLAAAGCWLDCGGTLDALFVAADQAAAGCGGGVPASSSSAKGCALPCWVALALCDRCGTDMSEDVTSDEILGALDTATLPEGNMRLMSACNRRASPDRHWKAHKFNGLATCCCRTKRIERALTRQILPPACRSGRRLLPLRASPAGDVRRHGGAGARHL
jgi:hypothetical protein